jgi:glycosyltransferase involved in cell wall biosynthesis
MKRRESVRLRHPSAMVTLVTPGFRDARGGLESHVSALVKELAAQKIRVLVLTSARGIGRTTVERHDDCWVITYPAWPTTVMSVSPRLAWAAVRSRRSDRVQHVHSYHATTALALFGSKVPTVFTPHYHGRQGHSRLANILHAPYYQLAKKFMQRCNAVICVSEAERKTLIGDFPAITNRVTVIPNGIDASTIRSALPIMGEPPTVICVGRLEPYKHLDRVVQAFEQVPAPAQLVIIGDGSQRDELTKLSADLGLSDRVRLTGNISDVAMHRWMRTARVAVSLSEREAFGMAPLEAACAGARIILSDIPAHREIADQFLRRCVTVMTDDSVAAIGAEIQRQLAAPRPDECTAPDWREIATQTIGVYRAAGAAIPAETQGNQRNADSLLQQGMGK